MMITLSFYLDSKDWSEMVCPLTSIFLFCGFQVKKTEIEETKVQRVGFRIRVMKAEAKVVCNIENKSFCEN